MEMFLRCVIFVVFPIAIVSQDRWTCPAGGEWWQCSDTQCVWTSHRCDKYNDCRDDSDEDSCDRWTCPAGGEWWQCRSKQCVRTSCRCDGNNDCSDHSDEDNCDRWTCPAGGEWWQCSDPQCVWTSYRCDGDNDCRDGSDEDNCDQWTCPAGGEWWECSDTQCVPTSYRCDGDNDCRDDSDEDNCEEWTCPVEGGKWWQCHDKQCIRTNGRCEGYPFCRDGSDEQNCDYRLPQCTNGILQISETDLHKPFYCDGLQGRDYVYWERNEGQGETHIVAFCQNKTQNYSCDSVDRDVRVSRNTSTSQLVIVNYTRANWANSTLTCVREDRVRMDSCRIRVMYPAVLGNSTVTLRDNFTVTATVTVEKVFDSDFTVTCRWYIYEGQIFKHSLTTRPSLTPFNERKTGREYYKGTCSVTMDARSEEGHFLVYVTMEPGGGLSLVGDFNITKPGELRLQTKSCPEYVAEGQNSQCKCRHVSKDKGSPPARVYWAQHNGSAVLTVNNVTMKDNGTVYTCHSTWGPSGKVHTSFEYTILVAYGPSNATVSRQVNSTNPEQNESFTCTSDAVYPAANFSWNLQCLTEISGLQSSTCVVAHESLLDKTEVVCQVSNSKCSEQNSTASFKLPDGKQAHGLSALVIGSVVAAAGVIVIVGCIVFAIVVVTRRRRSPRPSPPDDQDDEFEEFINDIYEGAGDMPLPHVLETNSAKPSSPAAQQSPAPASSFTTTAGAPTDSLDNIYTEVSETTATETDASEAKKDEASFSGKRSGNKEGVGKDNSAAYVNVGKSSPRDQSQDMNGVPETDDEYNTLKFAKKGASDADPTYSHL
ncbi:uncharacterized protein [Littorina saxatilis]|uniref:uncharacterized protein n=1 Tax=Littorina saxatilis TaxID=31220 RepID=UPI0038B5C275